MEDQKKYEIERVIQVSEDQKRLVKSIVFPGCSDDEMRLYLFECERRGVHPLDRLIFPIKRNDKEGEKRVTFQCSVDYLRAEAADTGEYDGQDEPAFGPTGADGFPESATVSVYKKGISRPTTGTARWKEFYPGEKQGFMWRKMPHHMLAKCAEVLALRKAFPKRLAGLYVPEEMQSIEPPDKKPPIAPPQRKQEAKKEAAPGPELQTVTVNVFDTSSKSGESANGPWTLHSIIGVNEVTYKTFSDTFKGIADSAIMSGQPVRISYKTEKNGNLIVEMELVGEREVGQEG